MDLRHVALFSKTEPSAHSSPPQPFFFIYTVPPSSIASLQNNPPSCHPLCLCRSTSEDISLYIACPPSVSLSWNWQSSDSQWRPLTLLFLRSLHLLSSRPPLSLPALTLWVLLLYTPSIALNCWNTSLVTFDVTIQVFPSLTPTHLSWFCCDAQSERWKSLSSLLWPKPLWKDSRLRLAIWHSEQIPCGFKVLNMNNYKIKRKVKGQVHLKMKMYLPTPQANGMPGEVLEPARHFWNFTAKSAVSASWSQTDYERYHWQWNLCSHFRHGTRGSAAAVKILTYYHYK